MPPKQLVDLREFDLEKVEFGPEQIRKFNPHRYEMEMLSSVITLRPEDGIIIGDHRATADAFWVRGHIPGRPILPGVLMVELAAQLCSVYWRVRYPEHTGFFGFGGIEETRFRGAVVPGDRLIVVAKSIEVKPRRAIFEAQGFVGDRMVFETRIIGVPF